MEASERAIASTIEAMTTEIKAADDAELWYGTMEIDPRIIADLGNATEQLRNEGIEGITDMSYIDDCEFHAMIAISGTLQDILEAFGCITVETPYVTLEIETA